MELKLFRNVIFCGFILVVWLGEANTKKNGRPKPGKKDDNNDEDEPGAYDLDCSFDNQNRTIMDISYRGPGHEMYAVEDTKCRAKQGDSIDHLQMLNIILNDNCKSSVHKMTDMEVYTIDIVVQHHRTIRMVSDVVWTMTCNFEKAGDKIQSVASSRLRIDHSAKQPRKSRVENAFEDRISSLNVTIHVFNETGGLTEQAYMGERVRLKAFFHALDRKTSFKIVHCTAISASTPDNSYELIHKGCGDGEVITNQKGFFTKRAKGPDNLVREASSPLFEAFTVPEGNVVLYTCEYVVCWDHGTCDGSACDPNGVSRRRRREVGEAEEEKQMSVSITTPPLEILPSRKGPRGEKDRKKDKIDGKKKYGGKKGDKKKGSPYPDDGDKESEWEDDKEKEEDILKDTEPDWYDPPKQPSKSSSSRTHIILIIGLSVIGAVVVVAAVCMFFVARRSAPRKHFESWLDAREQKHPEYIDLAQTPSPRSTEYRGSWASPYQTSTAVKQKY